MLAILKLPFEYSIVPLMVMCLAFNHPSILLSIISRWILLKPLEPLQSMSVILPFHTCLTEDSSPGIRLSSTIVLQRANNRSRDATIIDFLGAIIVKKWILILRLSQLLCVNWFHNKRHAPPASSTGKRQECRLNKSAQINTPLIIPPINCPIPLNISQNQIILRLKYIIIYYIMYYDIICINCIVLCHMCLR